MRKRTKIPVVLADGFSHSDSLTARHLLAFKESVEERGYRLQVFIMRADGTDRRPVFDEVRHSLNCPPAWSRDGRTLYHSHDQIFAIDVATASARAVTDFGAGERANWHLSASPDGAMLAFLHFSPSDPDTHQAGPHRLCTMRTDGSDYRVLAEQPDGHRLWQADVSWQAHQAVVSGIIPHEGTGFWKVGLDGGVVHVGTVPSAGVTPALSSDGQQVAYCDPCRGGLHILSLTDGQSRQVSQNGACPSWSPDGKQIAFMYGDYELWTVSLADGQFRKLAWFGGRNYHPLSRLRRGSRARMPLWSPDGRLLWFALTKTCRLRKIKDPDSLQRTLARITEGKGYYERLSESQRAQAMKNAEESHYWDYIHRHGIIDFAAKTVHVRDGHWTSVAWGPDGAG